MACLKYVYIVCIFIIQKLMSTVSFILSSFLFFCWYLTAIFENHCDRNTQLYELKFSIWIAEIMVYGLDVQYELNVENNNMIRNYYAYA